MKMKKVESSSSIEEFGYNPETKELRVRFQTGGLYSYSGVSQAQAEALEAAESKGKHLQAEIINKKGRDGQRAHPHKRLDTHGE